MRKPFALILSVAALGAILGAVPATAAGKGPGDVGSAVSAPGRKAGKKVSRPRVEIAILLDTSGSMSGLIEQAKRQLWSIVNEFITAKKNDVRPELKVALYEYGKSTLRSDEGYIRQIQPLTDDLDKVSEELFALKTNGGEEYCGWVIKRAVEELSWSRNKEDLKVIYIAGNEPFTQGKVDYRKSCKAAIARDIIVNTIHCGNQAAGVSGKWKDGAVLADGAFAVIDHNHSVVAVAAPQDKRIAELGAELNRTYVAFGARGKDRAAAQAAIDSKTSSISTANMAQRAVAKANAYYVNAHWDLVDAVNHKKVDLEKVDKKDLPENMRKMTPEERRDYVRKQALERKKIQAEINKLNTARRKYVAAEMKKRAASGEKSLGSEVNRSLRAQAARKNFKFQETPAGR